MKSIKVVAAVIQYNSKILCVQREPHKFDYISKKYEFPGGKVEEGESNEQALLREIKEELNLSIQIESFLMTVEHTYPDFILIMHTYQCVTKTVQLTLNAHIDFKWLEKFELRNLDWAAADIPIVEKLMAQ